jgi:branched-chain amino acid aminotransferase
MILEKKAAETLIDNNRNMNTGNTTYYVKDTFVKKENAYIHVNDIGLLRGYAVFDYLKTYFGKPFRLNDHLERLQNSAKFIGLKIPKSIQEIKRICYEILEKNNFPESNIRIVITGGIGADSKTKGEPVLIITCEPRIKLDEKFYNKGIKIKTVEGKREISFSKTCNYIAAIEYIDEYKKEGFNEFLYVKDGRIFECTSSNIFIFENRKLITPAEEVLYGITRKVIFEIVKPVFEIEEREVLLEEVLNADEVFISSTEREIMPVTGIDDKTIGNGTVGGNTEKIMSVFKKYVDSRVWVEN